MTELVHADTPADAAPLDAGSLVWRYFGDNRMYLIGPRPAVLQNMLAELGQGVLDHSVFFADTAERLKRTIPPIFNTVYGSEGDNAGPRVRDFHTNIKGDMPDGSRYHALNPETYFWAHATFVEQVYYFVETFVRPLSDDEKEQLWREGKTWYRRYGVSDRILPDTYADFVTYWDTMIDTVVVPHKTAAYGVGYVTKGFPKPNAVSPLAWKIIAPVFNPVAAFLTTGGLPPRARDMLGLPWTDEQERRYRWFAAVWRSRPVNAVWDRLPMSLRFNKFAQSAYKREGVTP